MSLLKNRRQQLSAACWLHPELFGNNVSDDLQMQLKGTTTIINGETVLSTDITGLGVRYRTRPTTRCLRW